LASALKSVDLPALGSPTIPTCSMAPFYPEFAIPRHPGGAGGSSRVRSTFARAMVVVAAVTALAGALRLADLDRPSRKVFDEIYYASDGCWYAGIDYRACGLKSDVERSWVHPPLGKQLIALGIDGFGFDPFGWRVAAAVAGTLTVGLVGLLAFLLFRRELWAAVAALLLATEHLHFVQSRIAMLDVFLTMFVVLGFLLLVVDRRARERASPVVAGGADGDPAPPPGVGLREEEEEDVSHEPEVPAPRERWFWRPWRFLAGAAFGAAIAVKWSGLLALAGAGVLVLVWDLVRLRRGGWGPGGGAGRYVAALLGSFLSFALIPVLVYLVTWIPWLADRGFSLRELGTHHVDMASFHWNLDTETVAGEPVHPYMSRAWKWILLARPVSYYWQGDPDCCREILGMGNPVLFWGALVVVPYLLFVWRRDWRAGVSVVPILFQYLPWLLVTRPLFLFYMTPVTPFLALGMTHALREISGAEAPGRARLAPAAGLVLAVAVIAFLYFWPVLVGSPLTRLAWEARIIHVWIWNWV
jgi:dolichyl-phosphate-mannose-protein mannosyltransferase